MPLVNDCLILFRSSLIHFPDRIQSFKTSLVLDRITEFGMLNNTVQLRYLKKNMMIALKQHGDGLRHLEEMTIMYIKELLDKIEATGNNINKQLNVDREPTFRLTYT